MNVWQLNPKAAWDQSWAADVAFFGTAALVVSMSVMSISVLRFGRPLVDVGEARKRRRLGINPY